MNLEVDVLAKYVERLLPRSVSRRRPAYQLRSACDRHAEPRRPRRSPRIEEAIEEIRAGRFVVVVDDEDRENEGDLTIAAELVTRRPSTSWPRTDEG